MFGGPLLNCNDFVRRKAAEYWKMMVDNGSIDAVRATIEGSEEKARRLVDVDTVKHTDAREIGAEWICLQAIRELGIDQFLQDEGWNETQVNTALAHLIVRTVYSPSELRSMRIMEDNSAVCGLVSGSRTWRPGFQSIYRVAPMLYGLKDRLEEGGDYYLEISSPAKKLKEESMNRRFRERVEEELNKTKESLGRKNGTKCYEKVIERIGRARQKYPSISKYYVIDYVPDNPDRPKKMEDIRWRIAVPDSINSDSGIYFLRTNVDSLDEKTTWDYYNLTREIECTNRQLKTDLSLRPIYHQSDGRSDAHLFLGLLSYWIVNTIRCRLKQGGVTHYWTEIVRIMSTQKAITTEAVNALGEKVRLRLCSEPNRDAEMIYEQLRYRKMPFRRIKIE